jgi:hypothetical protein
MSLEIVPVTAAEANKFVAMHHRHLGPPLQCILRIGLQEAGKIVAVTCIGRPVARNLCDGRTLEVYRVATLGHRNACSMLYGAAWRAAQALGYTRLITYTLDHEPGTSLRAAGWTAAGKVRGRSWSCSSRPRDTKLICDKRRWIKTKRGHRGKDYEIEQPTPDSNQLDLFAELAP